MFSSLSGRGDVLPEMEEVKLLASNPNVIGSIATKQVFAVLVSIFYWESRSGGWPKRSPNSQVYDDALCEGLYNTAKKWQELIKR